MTLISNVDRNEDFGRRQIVQIKFRGQRLTERPIEPISRETSNTSIDDYRYDPAQTSTVDETREE